MRRPGRAAALAVSVALLPMAGGGCKRTHTADAAEQSEAPLVVRSDTEGLLLTWIDDKGDFHVEARVADVPLMGRDAVRVVDPNRDVGAHADRIFVVDLRQARPDGTYPVRVMARADFDALAVARREKSGPTLASAAPPAPGEPPADSAAARPAPRRLVVIYGAEWCEACHQAASYLRKKGIPYVEKDIEKDSSAAREMQDKLTKNGLRSGSIPVLDVRGKVMVGFNSAQIDAAL